ncbi:hypothetical protein WMW71_06135 [Flavobacterium buctense]|uniref:Lipoprotein n=1 Tax=Flavobacterium buctense TaxID=1648146 RepID=A0ABU9E1L4_9FLAO|nr:hypothetical protein [Flavobacterium buctense]
MKHLKRFSLIAVLFLLLSCSSDDTSNQPTSITIGNYILHFESKFVLEELAGTDSYVGSITGSGITLYFDYGYYTVPLTNLPSDTYVVTEDELNGHYRQIVQAIHPETNPTQIHLYNISEAGTLPLYNSLTVYTNNLSAAQQALVMEVFNTIEITE